MPSNEALEVLQGVYDQIYDRITGRKKALSAKKYETLYELYEEQEKKYVYGLGGEAKPEYGQDALNDLLDDVCTALA